MKGETDSISALTSQVVAFRNARDWEQFHTAKNLSAALSIEASEIQELFLWKTDLECEEAVAHHRSKEALADELADVAAYLLLLAHATDIDLGQALIAKIGKNALKYPVALSKGNSAKYTELEHEK